MKKLLIPVLFALVVAAVLCVAVVKVEAIGPPGCDKDRPYNCAMSRKKFDQLINSWCALAKAEKQAECRLTFYTFVYTNPNDVRSHANFAIPSYCSLGASPSAEQKSNIPDFCYVIAKQSSGYYAATKKLIEECGVAEEQDQICANRVKQQFLHDHNSSWASEPDAPTDTGTGVNTQTKASDTPFVQRVNIYLKWITAGIGVLAVFGLVISGIQYTAAGDNPQAVSEAKRRINNIIIGVLIYVLMFAALQWLIPGGLFNS